MSKILVEKEYKGMKRIDLDLKLYAAALMQNANNAEITAWLFHLVDKLIELGFNARIIQKVNGRVFVVNDKISEEIGGADDWRLQNILGSLNKLGIDVELYPQFSIFVKD